MTVAAPDRALAVVVHGLAEARAAATVATARGLPLLLVSAPGAGGYAGGGWWRALTDRLRAKFPGLALSAVLDCGDQAGRAMAALRAGVADIAFSGPEPVADKLQAIADQSQARLWRALPPAFDPRGERDMVAAIARRLDQSRPG